MNFIETFHDVLVRNPGKELVFEVHGDRLDGATSTELADLLAKARGTLRAQGLKAGDRAVLVAPNGIHWVATDLALLFEGAVVVPMYARQDPAELVEMMHDCAPTVVVVATGALADAIGAHWPEAPIVCFSELFMGAPVVELPVSRSDDDPVTIIYTSGTSGVPKGVVSTVANVNFMLPMTATALTAMMGEGEGDDRVFHYLPFCFSGSRVVLWTCLWRANPIHVSTDLDNLAVELKTARPNYLLNVPMLLDRIRNGVEGKLAERGALV
jgi:long-chain acyl-CoA synthetase